MVRASLRVIVAVLGLAAPVAGCAPGMISDHMPGEMALPADAPARPSTAYVYPAVHDMPAPRATTPMTDEEQLKVERDLRAARDRQEAQEGQKAQAKMAEPAAKRPPGDVVVMPPDGAKTSGTTANP
ncbi:MAG: hypothetical protein WAM62_17215 [Pseudolabrys sp.]|jgi:hypothetical protein